MSPYSNSMWCTNSKCGISESVSGSVNELVSDSVHQIWNTFSDSTFSTWQIWIKTIGLRPEFYSTTRIILMWDFRGTYCGDTGTWINKKKSQNGTGVLLFGQNLWVSSLNNREPTRRFCPNKACQFHFGTSFCTTTYHILLFLVIRPIVLIYITM